MADGTPLEYSREWLDSKKRGDPLGVVILYPDEMGEIQREMAEMQARFYQGLVHKYLPSLPKLLEESRTSAHVTLSFHENIGIMKVERG